MCEYNIMSHVINHGNAATFHSGTLMFFFIPIRVYGWRIHKYTLNLLSSKLTLSQGNIRVAKRFFG